jgi:hypothetical protein
MNDETAASEKSPRFFPKGEAYSPRASAAVQWEYTAGRVASRNMGNHREFPGYSRGWGSMPLA